MQTILCYGDSLTWCFDPENWQRYEYKFRWTTILEKSLGENFRVIPEGLNGRTTCFDHPFIPDRSGKVQFGLTLETHAPVDLVIVMLGINDMIKYLNVSAEDSAKGLFPYYRTIFESTWGPDEKASKLLIVAPPALGNITPFMKMWYDGKEEESKRLAHYYKILCEEFEIPFMDSNEFVKADGSDGVHMSKESNKIFGEKLAEVVKKILKN